MSIASSAPASQLLTSQDSSSSSQDASADTPIAPSRLRLFRTALGQIINTRLFENESAEVGLVVEAVNERVEKMGGGEGEFGLVEAGKALGEMGGRNEIMYVFLFFV